MLVSAVYFVEVVTVKWRSSTTLATVHSESVSCLPGGHTIQTRSPTLRLWLVYEATVIVLAVAPLGLVMVSRALNFGTTTVPLTAVAGAVPVVVIVKDEEFGTAATV